MPLAGASAQPAEVDRAPAPDDGPAAPADLRAVADPTIDDSVPVVDEALRESEARYRTLFDESFDGLFLTSLAGRILDMNRKGVELFGYDTLEDVQALDLSRDVYANADDRARILSTVNAAGSAEYEIDVKRRDGSLLATRCSLTAVRSPAGEVTHYRGIIRDITEERRAQAALRQSEARYREVFAAASDGITVIEVTAGGRFRFIDGNAAWERFSGRRRDALAGTYLDEPGSATEAQLVKLYRRAAASGIPIQQELQLALPGGPRRVETTAVPVMDSEGRTQRLVTVFHDRTDAWLAELARHESEERLRTIFDTVEDAVALNELVTDDDGTVVDYRILDVNAAYRRDTGLGPEASGSLASELFGSAMPREVISAFWREHLHDTAPVRTEMYVSEIDRWKDISTSIPVNGKFVVSYRDITARKVAELAQARLVAAVEQADEAIVITDPAATILYVNPAFERVSGYGRDELLGKSPRALSSGLHDQAFYAEMWATILSGATWRGTLINRRKDGTLYEEDAVISPITDEAGALTSFVAVKRDVTRERALEAQLLQAQKMEAIGQLAGGIAHDFNNLITAIRGYSELIRAALPAAPDPEDVDQIVLAAGRAAALTRQLLAFGRRQVLQPRVVSPAKVTSELAPMLRRLLGEHITLTTWASPDAGLVRVDLSQLEQVIVNLAVNAHDAMPEGGALAIETANAAEDGAEGSQTDEGPPRRFVRIRVADTGRGMDAETQSRAFEPFFTTKGIGEGSGMGLATVYGIVTQSGGQIRLVSAPGAGTTVTLDLPMVDAEPLAEPGPVTAGGIPSGSETILLVEDEPAVRSFAARVLSQLGYRVLEAPDGGAALRTAAAHLGPIDLLVSDVVMPGLSGPALAERIAITRPGLPALLISGFPDRELRGDEGATTSFLAKPFTGEALAQAVRAALATAAPPS